MFHREDKHIELVKKQYKKLEDGLSAKNNPTKNMDHDEELKSLIDLLSTYGNRGILAILELLNQTNESNIRIYGYKKMEEIKKFQRK
jgi:hypothetical protein